MGHYFISLRPGPGKYIYATSYKNAWKRAMSMYRSSSGPQVMEVSTISKEEMDYVKRGIAKQRIAREMQSMPQRQGGLFSGWGV